MSFRVGCFALITPFSNFKSQLEIIHDMGVKYADVTDGNDGASMAVEYGFGASVSLDSNPFDIKRAFEETGITPTSYCAHANLLDPPAPWRFSTPQILKAIRNAAAIGIKHVITTEGDPKTDFAESMTWDEKLFAIRERLYEPLRLAADMGVEILLEPHGELTDSIRGLDAILDACGAPDNLGINMDTGNSWLGGADPVEMTKHFISRIRHVHWKDLPAEMEEDRGKLYGCGMATIPLGEGVIDVAGVVKVLQDAGFEGDTTLEVAGVETMQASIEYLRSLEPNIG
ncbi:MAG: sugar phosphate isomerase/epimerase family protein [Planctomycetota bacterium]|nr:sugar phosphate isomerase/epimerase family protein [Planctomycetota bacterium]MDP7252934.1 sugar phosphate isomerase/epimerase family protein [Planctomycetota bacterium]